MCLALSLIPALVNLSSRCYAVSAGSFSLVGALMPGLFFEAVSVLVTSEFLLIQQRAPCTWKSHMCKNISSCGFLAIILHFCNIIILQYSSIIILYGGTCRRRMYHDNIQTEFAHSYNNRLCRAIELCLHNYNCGLCIYLGDE